MKFDIKYRFYLKARFWECKNVFMQILKAALILGKPPYLSDLPCFLRCLGNL